MAMAKRKFTVQTPFKSTNFLRNVLVALGFREAFANLAELDDKSEVIEWLGSVSVISILNVPSRTALFAMMLSHNICCCAPCVSLQDSANLTGRRSNSRSLLNMDTAPCLAMRAY